MNTVPTGSGSGSATLAGTSQIIVWESSEKGDMKKGRKVPNRYVVAFLKLKVSFILYYSAKLKY
jgi:hypothetical protein